MVSGWQIKNVASTSMVFAAALEHLNHSATVGLLQQVISEVDEHCRSAGGKGDAAVAALRAELVALIAGVQERCARDHEAFVALGQRLGQAEAALLAVQQGPLRPARQGWRLMLPWLLLCWLGCALIGWWWCRHCCEAAQRAAAGHAVGMDHGAAAAGRGVGMDHGAEAGAPALDMRAPVRAPVPPPPARSPARLGEEPQQPDEPETPAPRQYRDPGGGS